VRYQFWANGLNPIVEAATAETHGVIPVASFDLSGIKGWEAREVDRLDQLLAGCAFFEGDLRDGCPADAPLAGREEGTLDGLSDSDRMGQGGDR
jgi:hypothetical protein